MGWEPRPQAAEGAGARVEPELRHPGASEHLRAAPRARGGSAGRPAGAGQGAGPTGSAQLGSGPRGRRLRPCPGAKKPPVGSVSFLVGPGAGRGGPKKQLWRKKSEKRFLGYSLVKGEERRHER